MLHPWPVQTKGEGIPSTPKVRQTCWYRWILGGESDTGEKNTFLHFCLNSWQKPRKKNPKIPQFFWLWFIALARAVWTFYQLDTTVGSFYGSGRAGSEKANTPLEKNCIFTLLISATLASGFAVPPKHLCFFRTLTLQCSTCSKCSRSSHVLGKLKLYHHFGTNVLVLHSLAFW